MYWVLEPSMLSHWTKWMVSELSSQILLTVWELVISSLLTSCKRLPRTTCHWPKMTLEVQMATSKALDKDLPGLVLCSKTWPVPISKWTLPLQHLSIRSGILPMLFFICLVHLVNNSRKMQSLLITSTMPLVTTNSLLKLWLLKITLPCLPDKYQDRLTTNLTG